MPPAERTGHLDRELVRPGEPGFFNTLTVLAKTPDGAVVASKKFISKEKTDSVKVLLPSEPKPLFLDIFRIRPGETNVQGAQL